GQEIVSAFNGPADLDSFDLITHDVLASTIKPEISEDRRILERYYEQIRHFREGTNTTISRNKVFREMREKFPNDWLLPVELYELAKNNGDADFAKQIAEHLEGVKQINPKVGHLIDDGLRLVDAKFSPLKSL
ncbi:MAG: aromatic amino acid hydroxylase, partial [Aurantibacter sp.]